MQFNINRKRFLLPKKALIIDKYKCIGFCIIFFMCILIKMYIIISHLAV